MMLTYVINGIQIFFWKMNSVTIQSSHKVFLALALVDWIGTMKITKKTDFLDIFL